MRISSGFNVKYDDDDAQPQLICAPIILIQLQLTTLCHLCAYNFCAELKNVLDTYTKRKKQNNINDDHTYTPDPYRSS